MEGSDASIESIELQFDFPPGQGELGRSVIVSTKLDERRWRNFFMLHPEVRSIECAKFFQSPVSRSL